MVSKFIRIENPKASPSGAVRWQTLPRAERAELWNLGTAALLDSNSAEAARRHIFQIAHVPGVTRLSRVTFMGQHFKVVRVSQASRLSGMELHCEAIPVQQAS